jgi:hypothetical protein
MWLFNSSSVLIPPNAADACCGVPLSVGRAHVPGCVRGRDSQSHQVAVASSSRAHRCSASAAMSLPSWPQQKPCLRCPVWRAASKFRNRNRRGTGKAQSKAPPPPPGRENPDALGDEGGAPRVGPDRGGLRAEQRGQPRTPLLLARRARNSLGTATQSPPVVVVFPPEPGATPTRCVIQSKD